MPPPLTQEEIDAAPIIEDPEIFRIPDLTPEETEAFHRALRG